MKEKRYARGADLPQTKLMDRDVAQIRELIEMGFSQADAARHWGVSRSQISKIINKKVRYTNEGN